MEACRFLQSVLDRKEDVFVQVHRKGADKQDKVRWVSAKIESNRLVGDMKPKGLETYELEYGGLAKGQLADARKSGDLPVSARTAVPRSVRTRRIERVTRQPVSQQRRRNV